MRFLEDTRFSNHPDGLLHLVYFKVVLEVVSAHSPDGEDADFLNELSSGFSVLDRVHLLSRGKGGRPPEGDWLWALRLSDRHSHAIRLHHAILANASLWQPIGLSTRKDEAPRPRAIVNLSRLQFDGSSPS